MAMSTAELAENIKHRLMRKFPIAAPKGPGNVSVTYGSEGQVTGMSFSPVSSQIPEWQARVFGEAVAEAVIEHLMGRMEIHVPVAVIAASPDPIIGDAWEGEGHAMGIEGHIS